MKRDIDPCEDFHAYACGGFLESRRKTPDIDDGSFEILQESVDVSSDVCPANDTVGQDNFLKLSGLFLSCMDVAQIKLKRKTILSVVQKNLELFPVFNSSFSSCPYAVEPNNLTAPLAEASQTIDGRALARTLAYHNKMGLGSIISLSVGFYRNDPVLQIFGEGPFFSTAFYGNDTNVPASCLLDDVARDAVDFETQLAEIGLKGRDSSMTKFYSHKKAIGKLSALTPSIDWALALDQILPDGTNRTISIALPSSKTLQDLERLLKSTSPKILQNFMIWLVIRQVSTLFRHEEWSSPQSRRKHCVNVVNWCLGHIAGHYFVQQTLERGSLDIVKDMAMDIQKGFQENLSNSTMLNGSTAGEAIRKAASVLTDVGYATNLQSSESLQQFYKDYDVDPSDYFGNLLRSQARIKARSYDSLKHQVRNLEQYVLPQSLGAFYYMHMGANRIYIPAGVIQHPRFHAQGPEYINLGTIGYTLGHELVHGLTGQDRFFNSSALKSNVQKLQAARS
ncbi:Neprilysin-4 [Mortierella alpina]|nr:Neprilysin-4 [Mortierella alpina]